MRHKFLIPERFILKRRSMFTNTGISFWCDACSVEEGWGTEVDEAGYGPTFGISNMARKVSQPILVDRKIKKFNRQ